MDEERSDRLSGPLGAFLEGVPASQAEEEGQRQSPSPTRTDLGKFIGWFSLFALGPATAAFIWNYSAEGAIDGSVLPFIVGSFLVLIWLIGAIVTGLAAFIRAIRSGKFVLVAAVIGLGALAVALSIWLSCAFDTELAGDPGCSWVTGAAVFGVLGLGVGLIALTNKLMRHNRDVP